MYGDFYKKYFDRFNIEIIVPEEPDGIAVHNIIYDELVKDTTVSPESSKQIVTVIEKLAQNGAQGVILGCTELPLAVHARMTKVPLFDTIQIHVDKAVEFALS